MARPAEVFVRELDPAEAQRLVKITRTAKDRVRLRRAGIVLASTQGRSASDAAAMFAMTAAYAREVIHAFNAEGFAALDPKWSGGRPAKFGPQARETIARIAKTSPQQLDLPFTTWSLFKLVEHSQREERGCDRRTIHQGVFPIADSQEHFDRFQPQRSGPAFVPGLVIAPRLEYLSFRQAPEVIRFSSSLLQQLSPVQGILRVR